MASLITQLCVNKYTSRQFLCEGNRENGPNSFGLPLMEIIIGAFKVPNLRHVVLLPCFYGMLLTCTGINAFSSNKKNETEGFFIFTRR